MSCYEPNLKWTFSVRVGSSPRGTWELAYNFNLENKFYLENAEVSHLHVIFSPHDLLFLVFIDKHNWGHFPSYFWINNVSQFQGFLLSLRDF